MDGTQAKVKDEVKIHLATSTPVSLVLTEDKSLLVEEHP